MRSALLFMLISGFILVQLTFLESAWAITPPDNTYFFSDTLQNPNPPTYELNVFELIGGTASHIFKVAGLPLIKQKALIHGTKGPNLVVQTANNDLMIISQTTQLHITRKAYAITAYTNSSVVVIGNQNEVFLVDAYGNVNIIIPKGTISTDPKVFGQITQVRTLEMSHHLLVASEKYIGDIDLLASLPGSPILTQTELVNPVVNGAPWGNIVDIIGDDTYAWALLEDGPPSLRARTLVRLNYTKNHLIEVSKPHAAMRLLGTDPSTKDLLASEGNDYVRIYAQQLSGQPPAQIEALDYFRPHMLASIGFPQGMSISSHTGVSLPNLSPTAARHLARTAFPALVQAPTVSHAQYPKDQSILYNFRPLPTHHEIEAYEVIGGSANLVFQAKTSAVKLKNQVLVTEQGIGNYALIGIDGSNNVIILKNGTNPVGVNLKAYALAAHPYPSVYTATLVNDKNEFYHLGSMGQVSIAVGAHALPSLLDPANFGQINHIQLLDNAGRMFVASDFQIAEIDIARGRPARVLHHGKFVSKIVEVMADKNSFWLKLEGAQFGVYDLVYGEPVSSITMNFASLFVERGVYDFQFFDIDERTKKLIARSAYDAVEVDHKIQPGKNSISVLEKDAFTTQRFRTLGVVAPNSLVEVSHVRSGHTFSTLNRNGPMTVLKSQAKTPIPIPVAAPVAQPEPAPVIVNIPKPARSLVERTKEPIEPDEFFLRAKYEADRGLVKGIAETVTAAVFVDWVNASPSFKYYFDKMSDSFLGRYGLKHRGGSGELEVVSGKDKLLVSLRDFVHELSRLEKVRLRITDCENLLK